MTREEAIDKFKGIKKSFSVSIAQSKFFPSKVILNELCDMAIEALQAEPVKRGTWRYYAKGNDKWAVCSECGIVSIVGGNYCPNCGAKMKGDADK